MELQHSRRHRLDTRIPSNQNNKTGGAAHTFKTIGSIEDIVNSLFPALFWFLFYSYELVDYGTYEILSHWCQQSTIMTKSNIYLYFFSAVALLAGCSFAEDRAVTYLTREVRTLDEKVAGW